MEIWEDRQDGVVILAVQGKFDATTAPLFAQRVLPLLEKGETRILVDMERLDYISSAALRVLLQTAKKAGAAEGKVALASLPGHIREIFDMAGFTQIFPIYPSRAEALRSF